MTTRDAVGLTYYEGRLELIVLGNQAFDGTGREWGHLPLTDRWVTYNAHSRTFEWKQASEIHAWGHALQRATVGV